MMDRVVGQENVIGVWSNELIPKGTRFGPMVAKVLRPTEEYLPSERKYFWSVFDKFQDKVLFYLDGNDETRANWMRHVLPARSSAEQNLVAFQVSLNFYLELSKTHFIVKSMFAFSVTFPRPTLCHATQHSENVLHSKNRSNLSHFENNLLTIS